MACPRCRREAPRDAQFCPECGTRLVRACAQCGAENAVDHRFCTACGQALGPAAAAEAAPPPPAEAAPPLPAEPGAHRLVLVADDDAGIRDLVSDVLAEAGFRTVRAADGAEVMPLALKYRPALVVLDVIMPHLDGYTTMTRLRNHPATRGIPVVIVTGQSGSLYQTLSFGVGATAHLTKPFSPRQLMDTVEQVLEHRPPPAAR